VLVPEKNEREIRERLREEGVKDKRTECVCVCVGEYRGVNVCVCMWVCALICSRMCVSVSERENELHMEAKNYYYIWA